MSDPLAEARSLFKSIRVTLAISGALALILGLVILIWPAKSGGIFAGALAALIAAYLIVAGLVYIGLGIFSRLKGGWVRVGHVVLGLLYILAGVLMFTNLFAAAVFLATFGAVFLGISWIVDGIVSLSLIKDDGSRVWTVLYALLSIVAGLTIAFSPLYSALLLWWILGASLVALGLVQIVRAITLGRAAKDASAVVNAAREDLSAG